MHFWDIWGLINKSIEAWLNDYAPSMGAAISYYTLFSIAPLLIIVIAVAGLVFGRDAAQGEIVAQIQYLVGPDGALAVQSLLKSVNHPAKDIVATVVSVITLMIGATTVFAELQTDLDRIWRVPAPAHARSLLTVLRTRLFSFGLVLGLGFLLLVSLVISAAIAAFGKWSDGVFNEFEVAGHVLTFIVSFAVTTVLFALIYKYVPRARVNWRDVWIGAAVTALMFEMGKLLISLYIGKTGMASGFGAAGSLVVLLVWVYFSAQIFLLGAEFTWVYSHQFGSRAIQTPNAGILASAQAVADSKPAPHNTTPSNCELSPAKT